MSLFIPFLAQDIAQDSTATAMQSVTELVTKVSSMPTDALISWLVSATLSVGSKILIALVVYYIGSWIIKKIVGVTTKLFEKRGVEISLSQFIVSLIKISLTIILIFSVIGVLGIDTTSFLAIFASAGLAVGMALSGTLQNFAGGVLILFLKPFKVGDVIEAQGYTGTVKEISLFSTLLNTPDNRMIIIPNGGLSTGSINNFSKESTRRVVWTFGVAYGTDFERAKTVIADVIEKHPMTLKDQDVSIVLSELADSSVNLTAKAWCSASDYWTLLFDINEQIYARFNAEGIEFPFPQMDVHLTK